MTARTRLVTALCALLMGCGPESADTDPASGDAQLVVGYAPPSTGPVPSIVLLSPFGDTPEPSAADTAVIDQFGIAFIPSVLVVQPGQAVEFRNSEQVDHNVRVVETATDSTLFNVATPMGSPHVHTFDRSGGYAVTCDIHPPMTAFILVAPNAYSAAVQPDGTFQIEGVGEGRYTAVVWHPDFRQRRERVVQVGPGRTDLRLDSTN